MAPRTHTATAAATTEGAAIPILQVDEAIGNVERLYQVLTGQPPPPEADRGQTPIPVERDPAEFVQDQLDRLLRALERPGVAGGSTTWLPPLVAWESEREVILCLDLPGVSRGELDVTLEGNVLTVNGRRSVAPADGNRLRWNERPTGTFFRSR